MVIGARDPMNGSCTVACNGVGFTHRQRNGRCKMKAIKIEANKAGTRYAMVRDGEKFAVYKECSNYAAHVRGGIANTWRYVEKSLERDAADALMARKVAGKTK